MDRSRRKPNLPLKFLLQTPLQIEEQQRKVEEQEGESDRQRITTTLHKSTLVRMQHHDVVKFKCGLEKVSEVKIGPNVT